MDDLILELLEQTDRDIVNLTRNKLSDRLKDLYSYFLRPKSGSLLRILNLDIHYHDGHKNYLCYKNPKGEEQQVLDMTGGYGANLLGHKNPTMINTLMNSANNLSPSNCQASLRRLSTLLGKELSHIIQMEAKTGPWITTLSNSGTEAIEAAIKLCLLKWHEKRSDLEIQNIFQKNFFEKYTQQLPKQEKTKLLQDLKKKYSHYIDSNIKTLEELNQYFFKFNNKVLQQPPKILSLQGAYHGKSYGSLQLTANPHFKKPFGLDPNTHYTVHCPFNDVKALEKILDDYQHHFIFINFTTRIPSVKKKYINQVAGIFFEPIQGENGVRLLSKDFINFARKETSTRQILLVSDEIQSGLYRTGHFAALHHYNISADIYTFSKGLGGGVCKIAATCCRSDLYPEGFDYLHTSTFAEDDISSSVALKTLEILKRDQPYFLQAPLKEKLLKLQQKYPHIVAEVRGRGYMVAIEFTESIARSCHEFHIFDYPGYFGYFLASSLLHNESIRTTPSLSSPRTLRFQPSLYFSENELNKLLEGLESLLTAVDKMDMGYFFSHLYPKQKILPTIKQKHDIVPDAKNNKDIAVFFCHMIDIKHAKTLVPSLADIEEQIFANKLSKIIDVTTFAPMARRELIAPDGKKIDILLMTSPVTSEEIIKKVKLGQANSLIKKIQDGIDFCKSIGAKTIGLGQFSSILSVNGLKLDPRGLNITTGNAYTAAMTIKAALKAANDKQIDLSQANIACVGIAGNILSTVASIMADYVGSMSFIYHTKLEESEKYQNTLLTFFDSIINDKAKGPFSLKVKEIAKKISYENNITKLFSLIENLVEEKYLQLNTDTHQLEDSQIILCGANTATPFINLERAKKNSIVIDIGVPANVQRESLKNRNDILYFQGGLASLPKVNGEKQKIQITGFPLKNGTSYACLAETIVLTMAGLNNVQNTGNLSKKMVKDIQKTAESLDFDLATYKKESSL